MYLHSTGLTNITRIICLIQISKPFLNFSWNKSSVLWTFSASATDSVTVVPVK